MNVRGRHAPGKEQIEETTKQNKEHFGEGGGERTNCAVIGICQDPEIFH